MRARSTAIALAAAIVFVGFGASSAESTFFLQIGGDAPIADNAAGDLNPVIGIITAVSNTSPGFQSVAATATSKPAIPAAGLASGMDLSGAATSVAGGGSVLIQAWDDLFPPTSVGTLAGNFGGVLASDASISAVGTKNFIDGEPFSNDGDSVNFDITTAGAFADSDSTPHGPRPATYSMYMGVTLTHAAGTPRTSSFNLELKNFGVPEPGTLALAGLGGLGLVGVVRRRRAG